MEIVDNNMFYEKMGMFLNRSTGIKYLVSKLFKKSATFDNVRKLNMLHAYSR